MSGCRKPLVRRRTAVENLSSERERGIWWRGRSHERSIVSSAGQVPRVHARTDRRDRFLTSLCRTPPMSSRASARIWPGGRRTPASRAARSARFLAPLGMTEMPRAFFSDPSMFLLFRFLLFLRCFFRRRFVLDVDDRAVHSVDVDFGDALFRRDVE